MINSILEQFYKSNITLAVVLNIYCVLVPTIEIINYIIAFKKYILFTSCLLAQTKGRFTFSLICMLVIIDYVETYNLLLQETARIVINTATV